jgi:putative serine protease PepD
MKQVIDNGQKASCTISVITSKEYSTGSGFHVGGGLIVTAAHVIGDDSPATSINVTFDGVSMYPAKLVSSDKNTDVAIIYLQKIQESIGKIDFADSNLVERGEMIAVIASPEGFHDTSMIGRVTNIHQSPPIEDDPAWNDLILVDIDLLPGSSGGMVLNQESKLIGMVIGILDRTGQEQPIVGLNSVQPSNKIVSIVADAIHSLKK